MTLPETTQAPSLSVAAVVVAEVVGIGLDVVAAMAEVVEVLVIARWPW